MKNNLINLLSLCLALLVVFTFTPQYEAASLTINKLWISNCSEESPSINIPDRP